MGFINKRATKGPQQSSTCLLSEPRWKHTRLSLAWLAQDGVSLQQGLWSELLLQGFLPNPYGEESWGSRGNQKSLTSPGSPGLGWWLCYPR